MDPGEMRPRWERRPRGGEWEGKKEDFVRGKGGEGRGGGGMPQEERERSGIEFPGDRGGD